MELTLENFQRTKLLQREMENLNFHSDNKTIWHKIAAPQKMSSKRLKKLLMATGKYSRNSVDKKAKCIRNIYRCYLDWYNENAHIILWDIQHRISSVDRFINAIFGEDATDDLRTALKNHSEKSYKLTEERFAKEFEELVAIQEKYPDCTDYNSCCMRRNEMLFSNSVETGEMYKGMPVRHINAEVDEEVKKAFNDLSKLISFYAYVK